MGVLHVLVKWLVTVSGTGSSAEQLSNLQNWAVRAQPSDYTVLGIVLVWQDSSVSACYSAQTRPTPDIHIRRFVEACVGHPVSDIHA